ncbi:protein dcd1B-like isoform X1 [Haliotis cracherodii]|uniref:protein dcd1B-like isoform X1 n=1 Tax=Haliotis cracherodii TaxID=6455 RepID=UPI0039E8C25E
MTSMRVLGVALFVEWCLFTTVAPDCGSPSPSAVPNLLPVDTRPPTLVRTIKNAKLFTVGTGEDSYYVLHLYGTPYEMGFAQGSIVKDEATSMIQQVWQYMQDQIVGGITKKLKFLDWFLDEVATFGLDAALDLELLATKKYTSQAFFDEVRGLADATGQDYKTILYIHLIGELTKGSCSMIGAWGDSLARNGSLLQLRALDWAVDGPFKDFPQVTVYHPVNTTYGQPWANFGWTGWIGSITGMNSVKMAISEIGVSFPDASFGKESRFGIPFTNILRDILQYDTTLNAAVQRITNAKRTCDLLLGVGDGKSKTFRGVEYSASTANFYDDATLQPLAVWHPRIKDVVYWGMDWECPGYSQVLATQIQRNYGHLDASLVMRDVVSIVQTGNMQVAVYDLTENIAYLANARGSFESGPEYAYERQFVRMNMTQIFAEPMPSLIPHTHCILCPK